MKIGTNFYQIIWRTTQIIEIFFCLSKQLLKRLFSKSASRKLSELTFTFREIFLIGVLKCLYKCLFKRYIWEVFLRCLISFTREFVIFEWVLLIEFIVHYSTLEKKGWSREKVTKYRSYALLMRDGQWGWSIICWRTPRHLPPPCCNTHCTDESLTQWVKVILDALCEIYIFKFRIFWEGQQILRNLHLTFVYST